MSSIIISSSVDGELLRYVANCLAMDGDLEVFTTLTEAEYRLEAKGSKWTRLGLRLKMYCLHPKRY